MTTQTNAEVESSTKPEKLSRGLWTGYFLGAAGCVTCLWLAFRMQPTKEEWSLNLLLCLFGLAVGWSVGVLLSPMTAIEETWFTRYGKALSAFVTGFVLAKIDPLLRNFRFAPADSEVWLARILLFGVTLIIGFQFTFMARRPARPIDGQSKRPHKYLRTKFKV